MINAGERQLGRWQRKGVTDHRLQLQPVSSLGSSQSADHQGLGPGAYPAYFTLQCSASDLAGRWANPAGIQVTQGLNTCRACRAQRRRPPVLLEQSFRASTEEEVALC